MFNNQLDSMDFINSIGVPSSYQSEEFLGLQLEALRSRMNLSKALETGDGQVLSTDTGGRAVRTEFIHGAMANETFSDIHCVTFNRMDKVPIRNTAVQWVAKNDLGYDGDGLLAETGLDGAFNGGDESDSDYRRELENVAFVHDIRKASILTGMVDNVVDLQEDGRKDAIRTIKARSNRNVIYGNRRTNALSPNGVLAQMISHMDKFPEDRDVMIDAGGYRMDKDILEECCRVGNDKFAFLKDMYMSSKTKADLMQSLFPQQRDTEPGASETFGLDKRRFVNPYNDGHIDLIIDPLLRSNQPLVPIGKGHDGKMRTADNVDPKAPATLGAVLTAVTGAAAQAAGDAYYWKNVTTNDMETVLATAPATPNPAADGSYNDNRLAAGTYKYAVAPVFLGREGLPWFFGSDGAIANAAGVAVTAGQIVKLTVNANAVAGFAAAIPRSWLRFRIYRAPNTATKSADYDFLTEVGVPKTGSITTAYDNGMMIPGSDTAFIISPSDEDGKLWFFAQLLPLMKRDLPNQLMADLKGYLLFGTPILKKRGRHIWVRNIGRTARA